MTATRDVQGETADTRFFDVLSHRTRRRVLRVLERRPGSTSVNELSAHVAALSGGDSDGPRTSRAECRARLAHRHLPKLVESGLVRRADDGSVDLTGHPALQTTGIRQFLADGDGREPVADVLADDRRRAILAITETRTDPVSRRELARELAGADEDGQPDESTVRDVVIRLHHCDLPRLDEAGLIEYDDTEQTVEFTGSETLVRFLSEFH